MQQIVGRRYTAAAGVDLPNLSYVCITLQEGVESLKTIAAKTVGHIPDKERARSGLAVAHNGVKAGNGVGFGPFQYGSLVAPVDYPLSHVLEPRAPVAITIAANGVCIPLPPYLSALFSLSARGLL